MAQGDPIPDINVNITVEFSDGSISGIVDTKTKADGTYNGTWYISEERYNRVNRLQAIASLNGIDPTPPLIPTLPPYVQARSQGILIPPLLYHRNKLIKVKVKVQETIPGMVIQPNFYQFPYTGGSVDITLSGIDGTLKVSAGLPTWMTLTKTSDTTFRLVAGQRTSSYPVNRENISFYTLTQEVAFTYSQQ